MGYERTRKKSVLDSCKEVFVHTRANGKDTYYLPTFDNTDTLELEIQPQKSFKKDGKMILSAPTKDYLYKYYKLLKGIFR